MIKPGIVLAFLFAPMLAAAGPEAFSKGPLIKDFGPNAEVPEGNFPIDKNRVHKVVFDVSDSPDDPERVNPGIETLARYLNMHARAGVPADKMQLALVVHGKAGKDMLGNAAYRQRLQVDNPNLPLLKALAGAGVKIWICGQTAAFRGYEKSDLAKPVGLALSALSVLEELQHQGYSLIAF